MSVCVRLTVSVVQINHKQALDPWSPSMSQWENKGSLITGCSSWAGKMGLCSGAPHLALHLRGRVGRSCAPAQLHVRAHWA